MDAQPKDIEIELLSSKTHNVWYLSKRPKLSMFYLTNKEA